MGEERQSGVKFLVQGNNVTGEAWTPDLQIRYTVNANEMCLKLALLGLIRVYVKTTMGRQGRSIWPSASRTVLYQKPISYEFLIVFRELRRPRRRRLRKRHKTEVNSIRQMLAISNGVEFFKTVSKFRIRKSKSLCSCPQRNVKLGNFTS